MNIQTLAYNSKKIKKTEAQDIVENLYNSFTDDKETQKDIAKLYKYFMPTLPKKPKTLFQWLGMACGKEEVRPYLHHIWCDGENAVATNGHILFAAPCEKPEGFYDWQGNKIESDLTFPQWQRVIPNYNASDNFDFNELKLGDRNGYHHDKAHGHDFDMAYIEQALAFGGKVKYCQWNFDGTPMLITFDDMRRAVIMPRRK